MTNGDPIEPERDAETEISLPEEAVVVRGGLSAAETLAMTAFAHYDVHGDFAISVRSKPGMTADEMAHVEPALPQPRLRETTVGDLRAAGYDVVRDEPPPTHALIMLDPFPADDVYVRIASIFG